MELRKVYVVGGSLNYARWLLEIGFVPCQNKEDADMALFTGGEDVDPSLYKEKVGGRTFINSERDIKEALLFEYFQNKNIPMMGICRGGQFLTVMSGGRLIQDVSGHGTSAGHKIVDTETNEEYHITSTHHQMFYPYDLPKEDYNIVAHSKYKLSTHYLDGDDQNMMLPAKFVECEVIEYNKTKCFCIQGHPEYMDESSDTVKYLLKKINNFYKTYKNESTLVY